MGVYVCMYVCVCVCVCWGIISGCAGEIFGFECLWYDLCSMWCDLILCCLCACLCFLVYKRIKSV